jgi:hypothetical protein
MADETKKELFYDWSERVHNIGINDIRDPWTLIGLYDKYDKAVNGPNSPYSFNSDTTVQKVEVDGEWVENTEAINEAREKDAEVQKSSESMFALGKAIFTKLDAELLAHIEKYHNESTLTEENPNA